MGNISMYFNIYTISVLIVRQISNWIERLNEKQKKSRWNYKIEKYYPGMRDNTLITDLRQSVKFLFGPQRILNQS